MAKTSHTITLTGETIRAAKLHFEFLQEQSNNLAGLIRAVHMLLPIDEADPTVGALLNVALAIAEDGVCWFKLEDFMNSLESAAPTSADEVAQ